MEYLFSSFPGGWIPPDSLLGIKDVGYKMMIRCGGKGKIDFMDPLYDESEDAKGNTGRRLRFLLLLVPFLC